MIMTNTSLHREVAKMNQQGREQEQALKYTASSLEKRQVRTITNQLNIKCTGQQEAGGVSNN